MAPPSNDGPLTTLSAAGKTTASKALEPGQVEQVQKDLACPADPAALTKQARPDRLAKLAAASGGRRAVAYWGGTVRVVDGGKVLSEQVLPQDVTALAWLGDRLIAGWPMAGCWHWRSSREPVALAALLRGGFNPPPVARGGKLALAGGRVAATGGPPVAALPGSNAARHHTEGMRPDRCVSPLPWRSLCGVVLRSWAGITAEPGEEASHWPPTRPCATCRGIWRPGIPGTRRRQATDSGR